MSLELDGVTATIGAGARAVTVLRDVSLVAPAGALTCVVGPSGSGKSSLLRVIAGLLVAERGTVTIAGTDVTRLPPGRRRVGLCFQDLALFPHLDVAGNLGFGLRARGGEEAAVAAKVGEVADRLDLVPLLGRLPRELSGGEAQRVALGRAVVGEPDVLLLDEPFGPLDPQLRVAARRQVHETQSRLQATTVLVTHDPLEALSIADHLVVLFDGRVAQAGHPHAVAARPVSPVVARLVGHPPMNVVGDIGVRPEAAIVVVAGAGRVEGVVEAVEPWAGSTLVRVRTLNGVDLCAFVSRDPPALGATVGVTWSINDEHRFDGQADRS